MHNMVAHRKNASVGLVTFNENKGYQKLRIYFKEKRGKGQTIARLEKENPLWKPKSKAKPCKKHSLCFFYK